MKNSIELPGKPDLTVKQFARATGYSTKHVIDAFIKKGVINARQRGRQYRIPYAEFVRFQEEGLLKVQYRVNLIPDYDDDTERADPVIHKESIHVKLKTRFSGRHDILELNKYGSPDRSFAIPELASDIVLQNC